MSFPGLFVVGSSGRLLKMEASELADARTDPRGIIWIWEPPDPRQRYGIGCDPSFGITGWNRYTRSKEDRKTNNGAVEVVRMGRHANPDYQVAEFAAPVDAFELAYYANLLGRIYAGDEEDQCKLILETFPGPGKMTLHQLVDLGYTNLWQWEYYAELRSPQTDTVGWHATPQTNRDLWAKASRHINLKRAVVRSPWLLSEYEDCRWNPDKQYAENPSNDKGHGDRIRAFNLAIWMLNGFSANVERRAEEVRTTPQVDPAYSDASWSDIQDRWNEAVERMLAE